MHPINIEEIESQEFISGFHGRMIHTERMTFVYWQIEAGAELPEHQHPQEQVTRMLSGQFEMTLGGKTYTLEPGSMLIIPPHIPHSGKALTPCEIEDVFQPIRSYES